jgi:hypothetical protein
VFTTSQIALIFLGIIAILVVMQVTSPLVMAPLSTPRNERLASILTLVLFALVLTGCNSRVTPHKEDPLRVTRYNVKGQFLVHEFHLQDGTRCVAISSNGITCQWRTQGGVE